MSSRTPLVSFIGIGAQKCGTTWIHRNLALHPQLSVAHGQDKDTRFFSCFYDRGYEWYEACFDTATADVHTGEVSTSYFHTADAPQRIKAYNPDAKLFVCLRNPVERVLSNHRHEARVGHISGANLALEAALENNPAYLLQSRYALHLKHWFDHFDARQLKVLFFDDLKTDPAGFMRELYSFLGVADDFMPRGTDEAANVSRVPASRHVERAIHSVGRGFRALGLGRLVDAGRRAGFNDWVRSTNSVRDAVADLAITDSAKQKIYAALAEDIDELAQLTGHDLSCWTPGP